MTEERVRAIWSRLNKGMVHLRIEHLMTALPGLLALLILVGSIPAFSQSAKQAKPLWEPYYISPRTGPEHLSLDGQ
jgi:hypothetical protein